MSPVDFPPPELVTLDADADKMEDAIRRSNRIPKAFPSEEVLELCRAAKEIARADEGDRPDLLQVLHEQLATTRQTIPRDEDEATGEPEFQRLRYALSELTAEVAARILDAQRRPDPAQPGDPRLGPPNADADAIRATAAKLPQAGDAAITQIHGAIGQIGPKYEISLIKLVNSGKAEARLAGIAVDNPETLAKRLGILGRLLGNWPSKLRATLRAAGIALDFIGEALPLFAKLAKDLAALCNTYAEARIESRLPLPSPQDSTDTEGLARLLVSYLRDDDTDRAWEVANRLVERPDCQHVLETHPFDLSSSRVRDIRPLAEMAALKSLDMADTDVSDINALAKLTALQSLDLWGLTVKDASALAKLTALEWLNLAHTRVADISALSELTALKQLDLTGTGITDVNALSKLTEIRSLNLRFVGIKDISTASNLTALQYLNLSHTGVTDVSALSKLSTLKSLDLSKSGMTDITTLSKLMELERLNLCETGVTDVRPLSNLTALQLLDLRRTGVTDVSPLSGLPNLNKLLLPDGVEDNRHPLPLGD